MRLYVIAAGLIAGALLSGWGAYALTAHPAAAEKLYLPVAALVVGIFGLALTGYQAYVSQKKPPPVDPIRWRTEIGPGQTAFHLLDWRRRLVPLVGRESQHRDLLDWARSGDGVKVRFLTGPGGSGKTRLAAEVADDLSRQGWTAGFTHGQTLERLPEAKHKKLLLLIDYPERDREQAKHLLTALARCSGGPVRALFISRQDYQQWQDEILEAEALSVCQAHALALPELDLGQSVELFAQLQEKLKNLGGGEAASATPDQVRSWFASDDLFRYPLLVVAAALNEALAEDHAVGLSSQGTLAALIRREIRRMKEFGMRAGFGENTVERLVALACVRGDLDLATIRALARQCPDDFTIPSDLSAGLKRLDWSHTEGIRPARPDLVAAELVHQVIAQHPENAHEWLWHALQAAPQEWTADAERLDYDIRRVHGATEGALARQLAGMIQGSGERAHKLAYVASDRRSEGCLPLAIELSRVRLPTLAGAERAECLRALSSRLAERDGASEEALAAIQEAVEIYRELADTDAEEFEPEVAGNLNNLSNRLSHAGEQEEALEAIREAVDIRRRLAAADPTRFEPDLAGSLNNLSNRLSDAGEREEALGAIREAVDICRRLAAAAAARFEPDLAMSLNNLSLRLSDAGEREEALEAIREAVETYRRLAAANAARFEPDLAASLNNLSIDLSEAGEQEGALEAIREAVDIRRRLAAANAARFEPELALSYCVLGLRQEQQGELPEAVSSFERAVEIFRRRRDDIPGFVDRYLPDAERELERLRERLADPAAPGSG